MIETITLRNYRGHRDTTIPCGRLTVLVGENATGKTSVLRAVEWISEGIEDTLPLALLRRGAEQLEVIIAGPNEGWPIDVRYKLRAHHLVTLREQGEEVLERISSWVDREDGKNAYRPHAIFLKLNADDLAAPSTSNAEVQTLTPSGRGLASALAYLKLIETERFNRIVQRLQRIVPFVKDIEFTRISTNESIPRLVRIDDQQIELTDKVKTIKDALLFDFVDAARVPASSVSEGTLIVLGTLTALELVDLQRKPRLASGAINVLAAPVEMLLIDDLDRALHPRAQRDFIKTLRMALDAIPNLQILATSHSPYLIDTLQPAEVVVLGREDNRDIVAKRLDEFPDKRLREMLNTGELWMSEGDDWVTR